jgi:hypothetical protein
MTYTEAARCLSKVTPRRWVALHANIWVEWMEARPRAIRLCIAQTHVLVWEPSGNISLVLPADAYHLRYLNRYLPRGYRVFRWQGYTMVRTPSGICAAENSVMQFDSSGVRHGGTFPRMDADRVLTRVDEFVRTYVDALVRGEIDDRVCLTCLAAAADHLYGHIEKNELFFSYILDATMHRYGGIPRRSQGHSVRYSAATAREVARACRADVYLLYKTPRTKAELIAQTEMRILTPNPPLKPPKRLRHYAPTFRFLLRSSLLSALGFRVRELS